MPNESENQIKYLKNQVATLEKQKQILFDFITLLPDHTNDIIRSITSGSKEEATEKLTALGLSAFDIMKQIVP